MLLQGLKYIGNKEIGLFKVLILSPTDPLRNQTFEHGEVKIIGQEIHSEIAKYLVSEYKGAVELVEVEVEAKDLLEKQLKEVHEEYKKEIKAEEALSVFCKVFKLESFVEKLKAENKKLKKSLKELTELKKTTPPKKKTTAKKKTIVRRRAPVKKKDE